MSNLSEWASRMKPTQFLYELERENPTAGLFMMKERVGDGVPSYGYMSPIYYVWIDDVLVFSTMGYKTACEEYANCRKEMLERIED